MNKKIAKYRQQIVMKITQKAIRKIRNASDRVRQNWRQWESLGLAIIYMAIRRIHKT